MVRELFSDTLPLYSQQITNPDLLVSLEQLKKCLHIGDLEIREWTEEKIAIPIWINVTLPPLGNADNLDIRSREPVLLVFDPKNYPYTAPIAYSNRFDFPKNRLGHLYVAAKGKPPAFCLVRGNLDEWYADKMVKDVIIRIENWFRDAATGQLNEDGAQFEPLRLEGYVGDFNMIMTYSINMFNKTNVLLPVPIMQSYYLSVYQLATKH